MSPRCTILVSLIVSASAFAQDSPPAQVDVRGKAFDYDPRRDDTAARIVVRHDDLVKYGDTSLLDALRRIPGVTVNACRPASRSTRWRPMPSSASRCGARPVRTCRPRPSRARSTSC